MLGILAADNDDSCTTYYCDSDNDSFGTTSSQCLSSPTGYYTSANASDCSDDNADANPAQTGYFSTDRGDGSYDYNCNGTSDKRYSSRNYDGCSFADDGTCTTTGQFGWDPSAVPSCGSSGSTGVIYRYRHTCVEMPSKLVTITCYH